MKEQQDLHLKPEKILYWLPAKFKGTEVIRKINVDFF